MTLFLNARAAVSNWFSRPAPQTQPDDLRQDYILRLMSNDSCAGEYGVQAFMCIFPKDF